MSIDAWVLEVKKGLLALRESEITTSSIDKIFNNE